MLKQKTDQENDDRRPLRGSRVLALTQLAAGPYAATLLADLGAEVIKVEDPKRGGDSARYTPPFVGEKDSLYFQSLNRNQESIALDLKNNSGRDIFEALVKKSDAILCNLRGSEIEKLRLRYEDLAPINPAIVVVPISGYGLQGQLAEYPGYDPLIQAYTGFMAITGEPDGPPTKCGVSVVDFASGLIASTATLAGIISARSTGVGQQLDVSLYDTALSMLSYMAAWALNRSWSPERRSLSAHQSLVPSQNFATSDGWVTIICAKDKFFVKLANLMNLPELLEDPRFRTMSLRFENQSELLPILAKRFRERSTSDWISCFGDQVPITRINSLEDCIKSESPIQPNIVTATHSIFGEVKQIGSPIRTRSSTSTVQRAPGLGEHNRSIVSNILGWTEDQIQNAEATGAFG